MRRIAYCTGAYHLSFLSAWCAGRIWIGHLFVPFDCLFALTVYHSPFFCCLLNRILRNRCDVNLCQHTHNHDRLWFVCFRLPSTFWPLSLCFIAFYLFYVMCNDGINRYVHHVRPFSKCFAYAVQWCLSRLFPLFWSVDFFGLLVSLLYITIWTLYFFWCASVRMFLFLIFCL